MILTISNIYCDLPHFSIRNFAVVFYCIDDDLLLFYTSETRVENNREGCPNVKKGKKMKRTQQVPKHGSIGLRKRTRLHTQ